MPIYRYTRGGVEGELRGPKVADLLKQAEHDTETGQAEPLDIVSDDGLSTLVDRKGMATYLGAFLPSDQQVAVSTQPPETGGMFVAR